MTDTALEQNVWRFIKSKLSFHFNERPQDFTKIEGMDGLNKATENEKLKKTIKLYHEATGGFVPKSLILEMGMPSTDKRFPEFTTEEAESHGKNIVFDLKPRNK